MPCSDNLNYIYILLTVETANDIALYNAATLLLHIEEHTEALKLLDRMGRSGVMAGNSLNVKANTLRGWIELSAGVNPSSPTAMLEVREDLQFCCFLYPLIVYWCIRLSPISVVPWKQILSIPMQC